MAVAILATLTSCAGPGPADRDTVKGTSLRETRNFVKEALLHGGKDAGPLYGGTIGSGYSIGRVQKVRITSGKLTLVGDNDQRRTEIVLKDMQPETTFGSLVMPRHVQLNRTFEITGLSSDAQAYRLAAALADLKRVALNPSSPDEQARFAETARTYRAAATKPDLPEEARRFKVQAESAVREKNFDAASDFYEQGLEIAPWWPEGHFNRGIVLSELSEYPDAIAEMKRYLLLVPDGPDARAVKDKIYEWESKIGR